MSSSSSSTARVVARSTSRAIRDATAGCLESSLVIGRTLAHPPTARRPDYAVCWQGRHTSLRRAAVDATAIAVPAGEGDRAAAAAGVP
jgi:hypothetical protein